MEKRVCVCEICGKEFLSNRVKAFTCGNQRCMSRRRYLKNPEKCKEDAMKWRAENPERYKAIRKAGMRKYMKSDKGKKSISKHYYANKVKWNSRCVTRRLLKRGKINIPKKCSHSLKLEIHHEVYPNKESDIIDAINNGKIYFLCKKYHGREHRIYKD